MYYRYFFLTVIGLVLLVTGAGAIFNEGYSNGHGIWFNLTLILVGSGIIGWVSAEAGTYRDKYERNKL